MTTGHGLPVDVSPVVTTGWTVRVEFQLDAAAPAGAAVACAAAVSGGPEGVDATADVVTGTVTATCRYPAGGHFGGAPIAVATAVAVASELLSHHVVLRRVRRIEILASDLDPSSG